jgi:hypothetical protein
MWKIQSWWRSLLEESNYPAVIVYLLGLLILPILTYGLFRLFMGESERRPT